MIKSISLVVIDDDELIAEAMSALCKTLSNVEVLGFATSGEDGLALMERVRPQVALVDLCMPRLSGVDVVSKARQRHLCTRCIVVTAIDDEEWCAIAMRAGAAGYLQKLSAFDELRSALHAVTQGKTYVTPEFQDVLDRIPINPATENTLTPRHRQVLELIVDGHANKQIADVLDIRIKTVEKHRAELMRRLRVHTTAELVKHAIVHRLVVASAN
jgi:DNA-binding NarL/FixJ family response regulator